MLPRLLEMSFEVSLYNLVITATIHTQFTVSYLNLMPVLIQENIVCGCNLSPLFSWFILDYNEQY